MKKGQRLNAEGYRRRDERHKARYFEKHNSKGLLEGAHLVFWLAHQLETQGKS
jgi:hypothetical protein